MNNFKLKKDREKLSEQEIQQHMNFNKFISGYAPVKGGLPKGPHFYSIVITASVMLSAAVYFMLSSDDKNTASYTPFINPPTNVINKHLDLFTCNNSTDTSFVYLTGTQIHVPKSAFVDANGNNVKGSIQIQYREFHDPIDILLSGIPMGYDSAGVHYQLESAGMFEVMAYQGGQKLTLKPDKEISVNMLSRTNKGDNYNIYYLDTAKRQWDYLSQNTSTNNTCIPVFDRNPAYASEFKSNDEFENLHKPVRPKKENSKAYNFVIDFQKDEFPELAVFSGLKFEPVENKKKAHSALAEKTWDDVSIERGNDDERYVITFRSEKETHSIKVIPVVDEKNYAETMKDFEKRQRKYMAVLAERKKLANNKRDSLYRIRAVFSGMALRSNLNERFNNFIDNSFTETSRDLLVYRLFTINNLGVWNSDRPLKFFNASTNYNHIAQFTNDKNELLILKSVHMINRTINSSYAVYEQNFSHFPFGSTINVIIGIGHDNQVYYLKDEDLNKINTENKTLLFKMKQLNGVTNQDQLKQLLKV